MPAVVRGGRRQNPKTPKNKGAASRKGGRTAAPGPVVGKLSRGTGLPPAVITSVGAGALALALSVALFTGGRAEALGNAVGQAFDGRLAAMGFKLKRVHIQGASEFARPDVIAATELTRDMPLARMDLAALQARVEAVGWVESAKVMRLLPDTLVIAVEERERLAVWQHQGRAAVIDSEGRIIPEADPGRFPELPLIVGQGADETASQILPLVQARPRLTARLEALVRVDGRRWDLRMKDGGLIQLPATEEDSALIRLDALDQRQRVLELGFERIDLRDPEVIAVRPRAVRGGSAVGAGPVDVVAEGQG